MNDIPSSGGLWQRYRAMPMGLQVLTPLVIVALLAGVVVWATGGSDDDGASSDTTVADDTNLDEVLRGIIIVGGLSGSSDTTTASAPTETSVAAPDPTDAPASTEPVVTTAAPATTPVPDATDAPEATDSPVVTDAPETTSEAVTTDGPATTDAPATSEAPATTDVPATRFPTVTEFVDQWNAATGGTDVPTISADEATELTGDYAGYHLITLSSQVGVLGTLTSPGSGQLDEVLLVWIPGAADDEASDFFWESFAVLTQATSPRITDAETAALEQDLGRAPGLPPFATTASASSRGFDYRLFSQPYDGDDGTIDVSAISVT